MTLTETIAIGIDLGKAAESTAVALVERVTPTGWISEEECPISLCEFHVRHLKRFPPNTHYSEAAKYLSELLALPMLKEAAGPVHLIVDQTAVGTPVADFVLAGRYAKRVAISAQQTETHTSDGLYRVPKLTLLGNLETLLEAARLKIAQALTEAQPLVDELVNYRGRKTNSAAIAADTWREQPSDDLVFAVALAVWKLQQPGFRYEFL